MAFIFFDSCGDNYATATLPADWTSATNASVSGSGFTGNALTRASTAAWSVGIPNLSVGLNTPLCFGMRLYFTALPSSTGSVLLIGANTGTQIELDVTPAGVLSVVNGPATAASTIAISTWYYIELWFPNGFGAAIVPCDIYVNGSLLVSANYTGGFPAFPITAAVMGNAMAGSANTGLCANFIDDFYVLDGTQSVNNAPLGPQVVKIASPNGAGHLTQFTPFGMGANWQCVSIIPPPGDTDYVTGSVVGTTDAYALSTISGLSQLNGVMTLANARQTVNGGGRTLNVGIGNGTTQNYTQPQSLTTTYTMLNAVFNANPFTASPWALGDLTTLQGSVQIAS